MNVQHFELWVRHIRSTPRGWMPIVHSTKSSIFLHINRSMEIKSNYLEGPSCSKNEVASLYHSWAVPREIIWVQSTSPSLLWRCKPIPQNLTEDRMIWRRLQENAYCILDGDCRYHRLSAPGPLTKVHVAFLFVLRKAMHGNAWVFNSSIAKHNTSISRHSWSLATRLVSHSQTLAL